MAKHIKSPEVIRMDAVIRQMRARYCACCTQSVLFCSHYCVCRPTPAFPWNRPARDRRQIVISRLPVEMALA